MKSFLSFTIFGVLFFSAASYGHTDRSTYFQCLANKESSSNLWRQNYLGDRSWELTQKCCADKRAQYAKVTNGGYVSALVSERIACDGKGEAGEGHIITCGYGAINDRESFVWELYTVNDSDALAATCCESKEATVAFERNMTTGEVKKLRDCPSPHPSPFRVICHTGPVGVTPYLGTQFFDNQASAHAAMDTCCQDPDATAVSVETDEKELESKTCNWQPK